MPEVNITKGTDDQKIEKLAQKEELENKTLNEIEEFLEENIEISKSGAVEEINEIIDSPTFDIVVNRKEEKFEKSACNKLEKLEKVSEFNKVKYIEEENIETPTFNKLIELEEGKIEKSECNKIENLEEVLEFNKLEKIKEDNIETSTFNRIIELEEEKIEKSGCNKIEKLEEVLEFNKIQKIEEENIETPTFNRVIELEEEKIETLNANIIEEINDKKIKKPAQIENLEKEFVEEKVEISKIKEEKTKALNKIEKLEEKKNKMPKIRKPKQLEKEIIKETRTVEKNISINKNIIKENRTEMICFLILPLGIPGMGKSFMESVIKKIALKKGYQFSSIVSDNIRLESMEIYKSKNIDADPEKVFNKTATSSKKNYYNQLFDLIEKNTGKLIIYCDKNHPPEALSSLIRRLSEKFPTEKRIKLIGISPKCTNPVILPNTKLEFSLNFILSCMSRVLTRKNHQTMNGSNEKKIGVVLSMLSLYKNYEFDTCLSNGVDYLLRIPFCQDDEEYGNSELRKLLMEKLSNLRCDIEDKLNELEELAEKILAMKRPFNHSNQKFL